MYIDTHICRHINIPTSPFTCTPCSQTYKYIYIHKHIYMHKHIYILRYTYTHLLASINNDIDM